MTVSLTPDEAPRGALKRLWHAWRRFGQFMADVTARVVLSLFYFTVFLPFGLYVTLFRDPLHLRPVTASPTWRARHPDDGLLDDARRQF